VVLFAITHLLWDRSKEQAPGTDSWNRIMEQVHGIELWNRIMEQNYGTGSKLSRTHKLKKKEVGS